MHIPSNQHTCQDILLIGNVFDSIWVCVEGKTMCRMREVVETYEQNVQKYMF